jgi:hypothetical protein
MPAIPVGMLGNCQKYLLELFLRIFEFVAKCNKAPEKDCSLHSRKCSLRHNYKYPTDFKQHLCRAFNCLLDAAQNTLTYF